MPLLENLYGCHYGEKPEELTTVNGLVVSDISSSKEGPVEWIRCPKHTQENSYL